MLSKVLAAVKGYATRVANMMDIGKFYKEQLDPHAAAVDASLANVEAGERGEGGAVSDERSPQDGEASPEDAGVSPQDLPSASAKAATP